MKDLNAMGFEFGESMGYNGIQPILHEIRHSVERMPLPPPLYQRAKTRTVDTFYWTKINGLTSDIVVWCRLCMYLVCISPPWCNDVHMIQRERERENICVHNNNNTAFSLSRAPLTLTLWQKKWEIFAWQPSPLAISYRVTVWRNFRRLENLHLSISKLTEELFVSKKKNELRRRISICILR